MKLVAVATKSERYFPCLVESCKRHGARLDVLGWGKPWSGFMMKYDLLKEYLVGVPDSEIVCVIDAYDVVLLEPLDKLEGIFRSTGARISVAKDKCANWFNSFFMFGKCRHKPINAGTYIGYAADLRRMVYEICKMHECKNKKLDDQKILTEYCKQNEIHIDEAYRMFYLHCRFDKDPVVSDQKIVYNGYMPCILHAPGNINIDRLLIKLGYDVSNIHRQVAKYIAHYFVHHLHAYVSLLVLLICMIAFLCWMWQKHNKN